MEEDKKRIEQKQMEEETRILRNNMEFFYYIIPVLEEILNEKIFIKKLKKVVEEDENNLGNKVKQFVKDNLIIKIQEEKENSKINLIKNNFSFNFFTTVIKNPEGQIFNHHCSPSLYGNNITDGIYNKDYFLKTTNKNEIYIVITIFAFNNNF